MYYDSKDFLHHREATDSICLSWIVTAQAQFRESLDDPPAVGYAACKGTPTKCRAGIKYIALWQR